MKFTNNIAILVATVFLSVITFSSVVNIYVKRVKISNFLKSNFNIGKAYYEVDDKDVYWAKEILKGGYILHFRHAERDKWIDVQMYDALESHLHNNGLNESRYAENDYFNRAVCLNYRGKIQAEAIGESLKFIGVPIGAVHSSVSCRARQTAELAFGGYDELHRILVHRGPYNEREDLRVESLKDLYTGFVEIEGKNTIVSAHNSVISCEMFINQRCPSSSLALEEGGFYILRNTKDGLRFEYEFHVFNDFNRVFYER